MSGKLIHHTHTETPFLLFIVVPYVVGINPNSPSNPHSAMASGGTNVSAIDTDPLNTTYILYGAVIGGPDVNDKYFDIRSDWPQTEVSPFRVTENAILLAPF